MRHRIAALHALPADAPITDLDERQQLSELLTVVRMAAERDVEERPDNLTHTHTRSSLPRGDDAWPDGIP